MAEAGTPPLTTEKSSTRKTTALNNATATNPGGSTRNADDTATNTSTIVGDNASETGSDGRNEAKTRFNSALNEAKAGAAALKAEAGHRADDYKTRARGKGDDFRAEAKAYGDQAKGRANEYALEGKSKVSGGIASLARLVDENASTLDEKMGAQYGDYARTASRSLQDTADSLDNKSIEELGEDVREFVRKSPGTAIGIAAVTGFMLSRMFSTGRR
ncbi:hypothetical protein [Alteripontixanthobacter muriae]|uniref:hypothetical protein n=1 Tax=Alteripontixanthobacter muriae TaxID=2705546 RepID=UPI0019D52677|nr:hypothetical protein [Alteripontixanthobacter muriae]